MEILKLSVNGEELNTIRGARSLLSKRKVCVIMMHVAKVQLGWHDHLAGGPAQRAEFSSELWGLLDAGAMDLALHLDEDVTGQAVVDTRQRPETTLLRTADQLNNVFENPVFHHDYLVARQRPDVADRADSPCHESIALDHFGKMFQF